MVSNHIISIDDPMLKRVWVRLGSIRSLKFNASSSASTGWCGVGEGKVEVSNPAANLLVFSETGAWTRRGGKQLSFTNLYRWTLQAEGRTIGLEHLRFGAERPVNLFDLCVVDEIRMESTAPHI